MDGLHQLDLVFGKMFKLGLSSEAGKSHLRDTLLLAMEQMFLMEMKRVHTKDLLDYMPQAVSQALVLSKFLEYVLFVFTFSHSCGLLISCSTMQRHLDMRQWLCTDGVSWVFYDLCVDNIQAVYNLYANAFHQRNSPLNLIVD